jgi:hypothetical protein
VTKAGLAQDLTWRNLYTPSPGIQKSTLAGRGVGAIVLNLTAAILAPPDERCSALKNRAAGLSS